MEKELKNIKSESRYSFFEATGLLLGHEVGAGILSIPFLASLNNWYDFLWILIVLFFINTLLHLMIAELSLNNGGAQFVECMRNELFKGKDNKVTKVFTWIIFAFLGLSVIINCTAYITGASTTISAWFNIPEWTSMLIYYVCAGLIVFFGMKVVGIFEKYSSYVMVLVILLFGFIMLFVKSSGGFVTGNKDFIIGMGLYGLISFAFSAVMSVPTVVKGLNGNVKKIRGSIIVSEAINTILILLLTLSTVVGVGASNILDEPATVSLARYLGDVVENQFLSKLITTLGYIFSIFAYSTSLWANTLDLRDMISEQTKFDKRLSWVISSAPSLLLSILLTIVGLSSLSKLSALAGGVQVLTGAAIVISFAISRKKKIHENISDKEPTITGIFGSDVFCVIVILSSLIATLGSVLY